MMSLADMAEGPTKSYCDSAEDPDKNCQPLPARGILGDIAHLNIKADAENAFAEIAKRWTDLDTWGVRVKVPAISKRAKLANGGSEPSIAEKWDTFKVKWINDPDIGELQGAGDELHTVEGLARDVGYASTSPQVIIPGIDEGSQTAEAGQAVEAAVKEAQRAAAAAIAEVGSGVASAVPTWAKVLLGVGLVAGVAVVAKEASK